MSEEPGMISIRALRALLNHRGRGEAATQSSGGVRVPPPGTNHVVTYMGVMSCLVILTGALLSGMVDTMEIVIWRSAYKHGVSDADIRHAMRNRVKTLLTEDEMVMIIGPAENATMLEVGIGRTGAIVHAMPARAKYWP